MRNDIKLAFEQGRIQAICGFPGISKSLKDALKKSYLKG